MFKRLVQLLVRPETLGGLFGAMTAATIVAVSGLSGAVWKDDDAWAAILWGGLIGGGLLSDLAGASAKKAVAAAQPVLSILGAVKLHAIPMLWGAVLAIALVWALRDRIFGTWRVEVQGPAIVLRYHTLSGATELCRRADALWACERLPQPK